MKSFKRSCWCVFVVEGLFAALWVVAVASHSAVVAFNLLPFFMLAVCAVPIKIPQ